MPDGPSPSPTATTFRRDVVAGLSQPQKRIPSKYFYDEEGSALFERITQLEEYYPTRAELEILEAHSDEMAGVIGPGAVIIEFGSGSSVKTRYLLDALERPAGYVPIDISDQHLFAAAADLREDYPTLPVLPLAADYSAPLSLPDLPDHERRVVYFPGSTIGNLNHDAAADLLARAADLVGPGGGLLIGIDLKKDPATLELAYNDSQGITAAFNRNVLARINRELEADFPVHAFKHRAVWNEEEDRIEMYLVASRPHTVTVDGHAFTFGTGEAIHTENSHKYSVEAFTELAGEAGFRAVRHWEDEADHFSVQYLEVPS